MVYVHNPNRNALVEELRRKADVESAKLVRMIEAERAANATLLKKFEAERSKNNRLKSAIDAERAKAQVLRLAVTEERARMPRAELAAKVEATMRWVEVHLPEPIYGGEVGLLAATREIARYRCGGRNGELVAA